MSSFRRSFLLAIVQNTFPNANKRAIASLLHEPRKVTSDLPTSIIFNNSTSQGTFTTVEDEFSKGKTVELVYEEALLSSIFCLVDQSQAPNTLLYESMQAGCIPILLENDIVLPFAEKLDWKRLVSPYLNAHPFAEHFFEYNFTVTSLDAP